MNKRVIQVFAINLKSRADRKQHIVHQFQQKEEFDLHIVNACEHRCGAIGLWKSITHILRNLVDVESDYVIICEDDHEFTNDYSKEYLFKCITEAKKNDADILLGGVSWFTTMIEVSENLFWVEKFTGTQFTIIYRKLFKSILEADFGASDSADYKMCSLSDNKFFIYPFISIQKDFGYSDATIKNNKPGIVKEFFDNSIESVSIFKKVSGFYKGDIKSIITKAQDYSDIAIPTYIIKSPEHIEWNTQIKEQFRGRSEFDINLINLVNNKSTQLALWLTFRKIIEIALANDDDVCIISEDSHEFTSYYSRDFLIQNIFESNALKVDFLAGSTYNFQVAIPVTKNMYWINPCLSTQFLIIYKRFFERILNEPFNEHIITDQLLSDMTSNKMVLFPFISSPKYFNEFITTHSAGTLKTDKSNQFRYSFKRLETIQSAYLKYKSRFDKRKFF